jgi:hypothetical protein
MVEQICRFLAGKKLRGGKLYGAPAFRRAIWLCQLLIRSADRIGHCDHPSPQQKVVQRERTLTLCTPQLQDVR